MVDGEPMTVGRYHSVREDGDVFPRVKIQVRRAFVENITANLTSRWRGCWGPGGIGPWLGVDTQLHYRK